MVPVASLPMEDVPPGEVERLNDLGYRGLKIIGSPLAIDDPSYFPVYAAAEERRMPNPLPPRRDRRRRGLLDHATRGAIRRRRPRFAAGRSSAVAAVRATSRRRGCGRSSWDTIANNFPDLPLIGAHLGGTGNYEEASSVARWRHNVVFDLSGGETIERHAMERRLIGREIGVEKLVWGSDCGNEEIGQHVDRFRWIFEAFGLSDEERERIWYRNAAELFGEAEPVLADEQPANRPD